MILYPSTIYPLALDWFIKYGIELCREDRAYKQEILPVSQRFNYWPQRLSTKISKSHQLAFDGFVNNVIKWASFKFAETRNYPFENWNPIQLSLPRMFHEKYDWPTPVTLLGPHWLVLTIFLVNVQSRQCYWAISLLCVTFYQYLLSKKNVFFVAPRDLLKLCFSIL